MRVVIVLYARAVRVLCLLNLPSRIKYQKKGTRGNWQRRTFLSLCIFHLYMFPKNTHLNDHRRHYYKYTPFIFLMCDIRQSPESSFSAFAHRQWTLTKLCVLPFSHPFSVPLVFCELAFCCFFFFFVMPHSKSKWFVCLLRNFRLLTHPADEKNTIICRIRTSSFFSRRTAQKKRRLSLYKRNNLNLRHNANRQRHEANG